MNFNVDDWARRAPACVLSHFSKGPQALICELLQHHPQDLQALLASYERRRVKGDRDPLLLDWMQGVTNAILIHKCDNKASQLRPTPCRNQWPMAAPPSVPQPGHLASHGSPEILAGLTMSQRAAVTSPADRALLVVAGAGSGKTKTLLARVRWLVASGQVTQASEILLLSFSRAACDELRQRLRALDRGLSAAVKVRTFHSFALDLFRSHREALLCETLQELLPGRLLRVLQHDENLRVVGEWEQRLLLSAAIAKAEENGCKQKVTLPCALRFLHRRKGSGTVPDGSNPTLTAVAEEYEKALDNNKSVDYTDLISMAGEVLRLPVVAETMAKLQAVVVDEFQDTSMAQLQMLQEMLSSRPSRLTAVGDPRQRIFSFQGSASGQFKAFQQKFHARELTLEENFRSTGHICGCATSILGQAGMDDLTHGDTVLSRHPAGNGAPVTVAVCRTERCEEFHARSWVLQQKLNAGEWRDLAILARTTATAQSMANSLQSLGVPVVLAGVEHYSQKEVQDVLAICRLLLNPADEHLLKHCLRAARVVTTGDMALLEAAMETGQEPSCIPSVAGADPDVTARLAKSLCGHPGRKARFLQGPLQDLNDLIRELRTALFPPGRAKGRAGKTSNLHRPKDATLRACLLLNGVAFLENGSAVWPVLVCPCKCRAAPGVAPASKPFSNLCLRCGGLTLPKAGQEAAGREQHICCSKTCATCSQSIEDGDLICQVCGQGQHLAAGTGCSGVPAGRGPMSFKRGPPSPWLCASCYADFATAWWSQRLSQPDFPRLAGPSIQAVLRRMPCSAAQLNLPRSTFWELCNGLAAGSPPQWLSKQVWRQLCRFVKVIRDLSGRLTELRLPELVSRVFRVLPWSRRYRAGYQACSPGLAEALRAEAEYHLEMSRKGESAAAELLNFLERLEFEGGGPFSATAAGSGTAEAGRGRDAVTIATAHASKGRQWQHVLVTRFNDGLGFPLQGKWGSCTEDQLQEEQRLAYVATSRACETLTLSYVLQGSDLQPAMHSRFLSRSNLFRMVAVEDVRHEELQSLAGQVFEGQTTSSERWQKFLANPRKPGSAMAKRRFQSKIQRNGAKRRRTNQV